MGSKTSMEVTPCGPTRRERVVLTLTEVWNTDGFFLAGTIMVMVAWWMSWQAAVGAYALLSVRLLPAGDMKDQSETTEGSLDNKDIMRHEL